MIDRETGYDSDWDEPEYEPDCACGANGRGVSGAHVIYEPTCEGPNPEDPEYLAALAMAHALDMVYASLEAADSDWERERDYYAEELALENRHPRKDAAA